MKSADVIKVSHQLILWKIYGVNHELFKNIVFSQSEKKSGTHIPTGLQRANLQVMN